MDATPATRASLRLLWVAVLALCAATASQGWAHLRTARAIEALARELAEQRQAGASVPQDLAFAATDLPFSQDQLDRVQGGSERWIEDFAAVNALSPEQTETLRGLLLHYMLDMNKVRLMEARGAHAADKTKRFQDAGRATLVRAVEALLGAEGRAKFDQALDGWLAARGD